MKVLLFSPGYDSPDKHSYGYYQIRSTLIDLGAKVIDFDWKENQEKYGYQQSQINFIKLCKETEPDILWQEFCMGNELHSDIVKHLTHNTKITTVLFMSDDEWRISVSLPCAKDYNFAITNHPPAIPQYHQHGIHHVIPCQWAVNLDHYYPVQTEKKYDVSFVGSAVQNRIQPIKKILDSGINIKVWGAHWNNIPELSHIAGSKVSIKEMRDIFSASKISLVLNWDGGYGNIMQIKGRVFELAACKTFQLNHEYPYLKEYYNYPSELVMYTNNNMIETIQYYLEHDAEREAITSAAYHRTIREHTWKHRLVNVFDTILNNLPKGKKKFDFTRNTTYDTIHHPSLTCK